MVVWLEEQIVEVWSYNSSEILCGFLNLVAIYWDSGHIEVNSALQQLLVEAGHLYF